MTLHSAGVYVTAETDFNEEMQRLINEAEAEEEETTEEGEESSNDEEMSERE